MTSHVNYAVDGYKLDIFRFVPKQDGDYRLKDALLDAANVIDLESKNRILLNGTICAVCCRVSTFCTSSKEVKTVKFTTSKAKNR